MTILDRLDHWAKEVLDMDGDAALVVAVEQFYQKTVVHEQLKMYFVDANMDALKRHQLQFMSNVFSGGIKKYSGKSMALAHERVFRMGAGVKEFDIVAGLLVQTLEELSVPSDIVNDITVVVLPLRQVFSDGYDMAHAKLDEMPSST